MNRVIGIVTKAVALIMAALILCAVLYPDNFRGVDTNVVHTVQRILQDHGNLYLLPSEAPFSITQYSPIVYLVFEGFARLLSISADQPYVLVVCGRLLAASFLGIALWQLRRLLVLDISISPFSANLMVVLFAVYSFPWYAMIRPDVFVLVLLIFYLRTFLFSEETSRQAVLLGVLVTVGVASKLNFAIFGLIAGLYYLWQRRFLHLFWFTASGLCCSLLWYTLLSLLGYDLQYLQDNVIDGINNGIAVILAFDKVYLPFAVFILPLIIAAYSMEQQAGDVKIRDATRSKLHWLVIGTTLFGLITALKKGSAANYLNEGLLVLLVWLGYTLRFSSRKWRNQAMYLLFVLLFQAATIQVYRYAPRLVLQDYAFLFGTKLEVDQDRQDVVAYLSSASNWKYFYCSDKMIGLQFPEKVLLYQNEIHDISYERGVVDYAELHAMAKEKRIDYLVLEKPLATLYDLDVDGEFAPVVSFGNFTVYKKLP